MVFRRVGAFGQAANRAAGRFADSVDDQTGEVARRASRMIIVAVRMLRTPTAIVGWAPVPFILLTTILAANASGVPRLVGLVLAALMAVVLAAFWWRRRQILAAVAEPEAFSTELGILISLSGKVEETRGALAQIAGGGGWRLFGRLQGMWAGASMTGRWINGVNDLPRAKYFAPPKIGTTVMLTLASLWLVPISIIVVLFFAIGSLASAF